MHHRLNIVRSTRCRTPLWARSTIIASNRRNNSTDSDLIARLQSDLKIALKTKDTLSATTIRSILSEIYAAQKQATPVVLKSSDIISLVRKAEQRRLDSMKQFESASRPDLAEREQKEAVLLASYLPAMLSTAEVDNILRRIIAESHEKQNIKKAKGLVLRTFYSQVDKSLVLGEVVRQRLDELWSP